MNKKSILILTIIGILILGTAGFVFYTLKNRSSDSSEKGAIQNPTAPSTLNVADEPQTAPGLGISNVDSSTPQAKALVGEPVISPFMPWGGNILSFINPSGLLIQGRISGAGQSLVLSEANSYSFNAKANPYKVLWSSKSNEIIFEYKTDGKRFWSYLDPISSAIINLTTNITALDWGDKNQIFYIYQEKNGKYSLYSAKPNNTEYKKLADIWENDDDIRVSPDVRSILYWRTANTGTSNSINLVSADGKVFKSIVKDGYNFGVLWAPDSKRFLFARREETSSAFQLWVTSIDGGEPRSLGLYSTVEKAMWDNTGQFIYVAGSEFSNNSGADKLYRVGASQLEKTAFDPGLKIDATDLFIAKEQNMILFKNRIDGFLYYYPLTQ